jgi:hypothetical protein
MFTVVVLFPGEKAGSRSTCSVRSVAQGKLSTSRKDSQANPSPALGMTEKGMVSIGTTEVVPLIRNGQSPAINDIVAVLAKD